MMNTILAEYANMTADGMAAGKIVRTEQGAIITIPVFKSTQDAQTFGRLFPESRQALRNERAHLLRQARREHREGSERVYATLLQAQFCREALEIIEAWREVMK